MISEADLKAIHSIQEAIDKILSGQILTYRFEEKEFSVVSEPVSQLVNSVQNLVNQYREGFLFIIGLSKGNLEQVPPRNNQFVGSFKQLHSDLLHLRWQTQQIAQGDYAQQVSFMGDFSDSFNAMTESLRQKQVLENELKEREKSLREATAELQQVIEMKDKLFSIIAHDLRGPIGNTGSLIKLILDGDLADPKEINRTLRMIYTASESTYVLLENLLAWSGSQRKDIPYNPGVHLLLPIFDDTIELYSSASEVKALRISSQVDQDLKAIFDPSMIRTVIRNLVNNAVKFTPRGGWIVLGAHNTGDEIEVYVRDNGIGMSPKILSALINSPAESIRYGTNHEKGHGLGLTLCQELIHRHDGTLKVQSEEGKGSTFSFGLPIV